MPSRFTGPIIRFQLSPAAASGDLAALLARHAGVYEPHLMRLAGGWLDGAIGIDVLDRRDSESKTEATVRFSFRTQCVVGCGTSATATDGSTRAQLRIDTATGQSELQFERELADAE